MTKLKISPKVIFRLSLVLALIILPAVSLINGVFGSFLFTFSIPLIWQVGLRGESLDSLGLKARSIASLIIRGAFTGCIIGYLGGTLLWLFGLTGYSFSEAHKLLFTIGPLKAVFPLQQELGYRLLKLSDSPGGIAAYLIFSIFVIGLGEELFWRGFIQKKISHYCVVESAIWITAVLFALAHFYVFTILPFDEGVYFLVLAAIGGAVWGYSFKYYNTIWPCAISHGVASFIIWRYYFFIS